MHASPGGGYRHIFSPPLATFRGLYNFTGSSEIDWTPLYAENGDINYIEMNRDGELCMTH